MDFGVPRGSEQGGKRPALIVSSNEQNSHGRTVIVAPLTTNLARAAYPQNVQLPAGTMKRDSVVLGEQLRTIAQDRLQGRCAVLNSTTMKLVEDVLRHGLGL